MKEQITLKELESFQKEYRKDTTNKLLENAIVNAGINEVTLDKDIIRENQSVFSIELPNGKRYDQKGSGRCWLFAGINMIKYHVAKNMNIEPTNIDLSKAYLTFFDKLEKMNTIYERVIHSKKIDYAILNDEETVSFGEGGWYQYFKELIKKYGMLPARYMKESQPADNSFVLCRILQEKVLRGVYELKQLKENNASLEALRKKKQELLTNDYEILAKAYGEPVTSFDLEYRDKDKNLIVKENMTPLQFRDEYLTLNLDDFVSIGNVPSYNKEYYRLYQVNECESVYEVSTFQFLNLPIHEVKELVIKQLKDSTPVWFGSNVSKMKDMKSGVMDSRIYNYRDIFHFDLLTKEEALNFHDIQISHAMSFVGVHLNELQKPLRWKVENSWGTKDNDGLFVMNDNFFSDFVMSVMVHKKYLAEKQLKALETKPIILKPKEF